MQRVLLDPEMGGFASSDIKVLKNPERQVMEEAIEGLFSSRKKDDHNNPEGAVTLVRMIASPLGRRLALRCEERNSQL